MALPRRHQDDDQRRAALALLHVVKKERAIDDDDWRSVMERVTGSRSLKTLDVRQLHQLLDALHGKEASATPRGAMTGPYAAKLRALWISGWHLGVVRDRSDAAVLLFVKRQTGLEAVRFLRDQQAAARAIEGLKGWLARAGGVAWERHPDNPRAAIVEAQWARALVLKAVAAHVPPANAGDAVYHYARAVTGKTSPNAYTEEDWDKLIAALGSRIRAAQSSSGPTEL